MNIPGQLRAGDSNQWLDYATTDNFGAAIGSSWTLKYSLVGPSTLTLTATAEGSDWLTEITKTQSALLDAGDYFYQAYAETGSRRVSLGSGKLVVLPNLSTASAGFDGASQTEKDLNAVRAAMRALISGGAVSSYTIGNRQLQKMQLGDLRAYETQLVARLRNERAAEAVANGLPNPNKVLVRFRK